MCIKYSGFQAQYFRFCRKLFFTVVSRFSKFSAIRRKIAAFCAALRFRIRS